MLRFKGYVQLFNEKNPKKTKTKTSGADSRNNDRGNNFEIIPLHYDTSGIMFSYYKNKRCLY